MTNPYTKLPKKSFWRPAVADRNMLEISEIWQPKITITQDDTIATAGSCFAQHISRALMLTGFSWLDSEPAPPGIPAELARDYGYGVFSFRTGNIYTAVALRQWVEAAFDVTPLSDEIWEVNGRYFDPLRPAIEPNGFSSAEECRALRQHTLCAMRRTLSEVNLFVFTLGLTECWKNKETGFTYAACPGTLAGSFDNNFHVFHNQTYNEILQDIEAAFDLIRRHNEGVKFLLTVSPVPLVATANKHHVLVSTTYSKSVLRAVAGYLESVFEDVEYFPSYEIISTHPFRGSFFMPNQREVSSAGVDFVMGHFFAGLKLSGVDQLESSKDCAKETPLQRTFEESDDIRCEEALLEAFSK